MGERMKYGSKFSDKKAIAVCGICFLTVIVLQIVYLYPFNQPIVGHDAPYHLLRIEAVSKRLTDFDSFAGGIDYLYNKGAGYAGSVYPDTFIYIPAVLRLMGVSMGVCTVVLFVIIDILTYIAMYKCVQSITDSMECGTIAAVVYSLSNYRIDNIFTRFALGEVQAYIFFPVIVLGLYDLIFRDFKKPWILALGYGGMLLSHSLSTVLAVFVGIVFVLVYIKRVFSSKRKVIKLSVTAGVTVGLTAFYWLPLLEIVVSNDLTLFHPMFVSEDNVVNWQAVFSNVMLDTHSVGMGLLPFFIILPRVLMFKKLPFRKELDKGFANIRFLDFLIIFGLILVFCVTDLAPWGALKYALNFIQFPWRLYAISTLFFTISGAILIYFILKKAEFVKFGVCVVTIVALIFAVGHLSVIKIEHFYYYDEMYFKDSDHTYDLSSGEWLPYAMQGDIYNNFENKTVSATLSDGTDLQFERNGGHLTVECDHGDYVDVPYIFYKGYEAHDKNGKGLDVVMNENGFVRVNLEGATMGTITVEHKCTFLRALGRILSLMTLAGLIGYCAFKKKRKCRFTIDVLQIE